MFKQFNQQANIIADKALEALREQLAFLVESKVQRNEQLLWLVGHVEQHEYMQPQCFLLVVRVYSTNYENMHRSDRRFSGSSSWIIFSYIWSSVSRSSGYPSDTGDSRALARVRRVCCTCASCEENGSSSPSAHLVFSFKIKQLSLSVIRPFRAP